MGAMMPRAMLACVALVVLPELALGFSTVRLPMRLRASPALSARSLPDVQVCRCADMRVEPAIGLRPCAPGERSGGEGKWRTGGIPSSVPRAQGAPAHPACGGGVVTASSRGRCDSARRRQK